jgi:small-conductance mechanosensitive channel
MITLTASHFAFQVIVAAAILIGARIVSSIVMMILRRSKTLTQRTHTTLDDTLIQLVARPIHVAFQLGGIVVALAYLLPVFYYRGYGYWDLGLILLIFWCAYLVSRLAVGILDWHEGRQVGDADPKTQGRSFAFLNTLIRALLYGVALTFALNYFGVNISALLAGLGIAGIAVALALQNTLSGVFSAVYLAIDKPLKQGDYVKLEDGTEGFVEDISMRSTRIKTFADNMVIVPNSKLAGMVMTNYFLPFNNVVIKIDLGVSYDSDLEIVEKVATESVENVLETLLAKTEKNTFVRFNMFGDNAIELTVFVPVARFDQQFLVKHECVKALKNAFEKNNIEIPFPQRVVHMKS